MALVIDLKPGEKILIGEAVITNDSQRTRLHIAGNTPIMRTKDVMQEDQATSPCKIIYFMVQGMYLSSRPEDHHKAYFASVNEIQKASPSSSIFFMQINDHIISGAYYKALKVAKELIEHERELIEHATQQTAR